MTAALEFAAGQLSGGTLFLDRIDGPTGTPRLGQRWGLTQIPNLPCFVQVCPPLTLGFDDPFLEINLDNPIPWIELGPEHLGMLVRVAMFGLDEAGNWDGSISYSNTIGPVLHASDPSGTLVTSNSELIAAMGRNDPQIVLAPGSIWSSSVFDNRALTGSTIITPQDNPARFEDSTGSPGNWRDVTLDGLIFNYSAAYAIANRRTIFRPGGNSDGILFRGCKQITEDVPPSIYQAVPPTLLQSPYRNNGLAPSNPELPYEANGTSGMPFVTNGFDLYRSRNIIIEGHFCRNTSRGFTLPYSTTIRGLRFDGWYGDCVQVNGQLSSSDDRFSLRGMYCSRLIGIYDEQDATSNKSGSGNAPHPDPFQITESSPPLINIEIDRYVTNIGDTRARAFGGTLTRFIGGTYRNGRIRNIVVEGQGSISSYFVGSDLSLDLCTMIQFASTGGGATRFGAGSGFHDEARISRSIMREATTLVGASSSRYYLEDEADTAVGSAGIVSYVFGDPDLRPTRLAHLALMARPRSPFEGRGALLPSGHMRPYVPLPVEPAFLGVTQQIGGFMVALGNVSDALRYELRYRETGTTGAWVRLESLTPSFTVTGLPSAASFDVQSFVKTATGLSRWSDVTAIITL